MEDVLYQKHAIYDSLIMTHTESVTADRDRLNDNKVESTKLLLSLRRFKTYLSIFFGPWIMIYETLMMTSNLHIFRQLILNR